MATRDLLSGPTTLSSAAGHDRNILHALEYPRLKEEFFRRIACYEALLRDTVAFHLGVKSSDVTISPQEYWRHGSFNLVVPLHVDPDARPGTPQHSMLRFPLPYRVGEAVHPGNSDEKLNSEAATYAWLQENCSGVPIPELYGFGLSTNQRYMHARFLPWWSRWIQRIRRCLLAAFRLSLPTPYVCREPSHLSGLDIGYLLIQTITTGEMLSETWDEQHEDNRLQENLQQDLAKIMISLAKVPLPRIGAFRLDRSGYLHLDNRPLDAFLLIQESEGISIDMPRATTFSRVDDLIHQHLTAFDNRLLDQPNAIRDNSDALSQIGGLVAARIVLPRMFRRDLRDGPFVLNLTDLHRSNIFVDKNWNITSIIDLEFACSWPVEFVQPPYWLSGGLVDQIDPEGFAPVHAKFVALVQQEEQLSGSPDQGSEELLSSIMQRAWLNGSFWANLAIQEPISFTTVLYNDILLHRYSYTRDDLSNTGDYRLLTGLWRSNVPEIIERKLLDRDTYAKQLSATFAKEL